MSTLLIVEDNIPLGQLYARHLKALSIEVWHTTTYQATIRQFEAGKIPQLMLLDMMLPDGEGLSIVEYFQLHPQSHAIEVIAISGNEGYARQAHVLGIQHFFCKPINLERLTLCVEHLLTEKVLG